ncbi:hypothetical protein JTE90_003193 [Oedothorax gibbosus]|uniref:Uncharacterized protein n=1 Tax=Oedothorax gibbosus TaxID=931172 RepID=A0AAV6UPC1_9ARAC|nr:hypothetical protein JTE90_003193 [Oedothorax gibbosus]
MEDLKASKRLISSDFQRLFRFQLLAFNEQYHHLKCYFFGERNNAERIFSRGEREGEETPPHSPSSVTSPAANEHSGQGGQTWQSIALFGLFGIDLVNNFDYS